MGNNTMVGYHGTTSCAAERILEEGCFKHSDRDNDWLGTGSYFFAHRIHAERWTEHSRYSGKETQVLEAVLAYTSEQLLDLDDPEVLEHVNQVVKAAIEKLNSSGEQGAVVNLNLLGKMQKWCTVCNIYRKLNTDIGITVYTFSGRVTEVSGYRENQRQICVSDDSIVVSIQKSRGA